MNAREKVKSYQTLKKEMEWIDHSIECVKSVLAQDIKAYEMKMEHWKIEKERCQKQIDELG